MGLSRGAIGLLLEEAKARPFEGSIATLGRQTVYATGRDVCGQFSKFGLEPRLKLSVSAAELDDTTLLHAMGFSSVQSLDFSDFEGATSVVDLNWPFLPESLIGRFDVVLDSGTLEHIFHLPNAMKNILSLLKVGGRVIFLSPSSNHLDHGFYMFSPTFFSDYLSANNFIIEKLYVIRYSGDLDELWEAYEYEPGEWRKFHIGGLDNSPYAIFVVATRINESTLSNIPQQGYYSNTSMAYQGSRTAWNNIPRELSISLTKTNQAELVSQAVMSPVRRALKTLICYLPGGLRLVRFVLKLLSLPKNKSELTGIRSKKLVGYY